MPERASEASRAGGRGGEDGAEERLRVQAAQRDPGRFAPLYEANFERVYAYVARRVQSREDAEDVTSEVFRKALASIGRFEWRGSPFSAWLLRIAANELADRARRARRPEPVSVAPDACAAERADAEQLARLYRSVGELLPEQRRVVELRFGEGRSIREIAAALAKSEGAVKQLQLRALRALRKRMVDGG
jgi:RNA polymerase sigma-70 factor (ECF subfamily)